MFGSLGYEPITERIAWPGIALEAFDAGTQARHPRGVETSSADPDQFVLLQFNSAPEGTPVLDLHDVAPKLSGAADKPDIRTRIELVAFHIAEEDKYDRNARATLRLDIGQDSSGGAGSDLLFWSIAAGIDLAAHLAQCNSTEPKRLSMDFSRAFKRRPAEIPGGIARLRVELVAHEDPPWWRGLFSFATSDQLRTLITAIGFPGITLDAVRMVDQLLARFDEKRAKPLFRSRPLTVAFTQYAVDEFSGGVPSISVAVLNPGFCLMLRQRDLPIVLEQPPRYLGGPGLLVPEADWKRSQPNFDWKNNPYRHVTYAILRVLAQPITMDAEL